MSLIDDMMLDALEMENRQLRDKIDIYERAIRAAYYFRCNISVPLPKESGMSVSLILTSTLNRDARAMIDAIDPLYDDLFSADAPLRT